MKLQLRFVMLVILILGIVGGVLVMQHSFDLDRTNRLLISELNQRKIYFAEFSKLDGTPLLTFSEDYSFWDDMVTFTMTGDPTFAKENLDVGLNTFEVDIDWVYKTNGDILFRSASDKAVSFKDPHLPPAFFKKLDAEKFMHFYLKDTDGNLVEIRAATIVASDDQFHKNPAAGYWIVGRYLDQDYLRNFSRLTQSQISLAKSTSDPADFKGGDTVSFATPLKDWSGNQIALMSSSSTVPVVDDLNQSYTKQIKLLVAFTLALMTLSVVAIWWYVLRPLKTISNAIRMKNPQRLDLLASTHTEFGSLAQTVKEFFAQKILIEQAEFKRTELEKLNKEKATFLAIAAHELNGPINSVRLYAELVKFLIQKKADEMNINHQLDRIARQINKVNMLVSDLRAASQGKSDLQFNIREFDFDHFLKEEVDAASFGNKHKLILKGETHQTIRTDQDRLGQVISNLIRNATKYSPDAPEIHIYSKFENGHIMVSVQDFGLGISEEDQKHLFQRFYRSNKVSAAFPGLGLGLSISKEIIERLGGQIGVTSQLGKGSIFYFWLPITYLAAEQAHQEVEPSSQ